ncbi:MAG: cupin-like domain-containing protein [Dokdonella sp.]
MNGKSEATNDLWGQDDQPWVERVSSMSVAEFDRRYRRPRRPVILTDVSSDWPAHGLYTFDHFKRNYGERTLRVQGREQRLADVIDQLMASTPENPGPYPCTLAGDASLHSDLSPRFAHALPTRTSNALLPSALFNYVNHLEVFFGAPGGQFPRLHFDLLHLHTWITQVLGDKEFTFYAPGQEALLYVNPATPWMSSVRDVEYPDLVEFPLLARARKQTVVVREGETLFIPCGIWHTARCVTNSITVAFDHLDRSNWRDFSTDSVNFQRSAGQPFKAALLGAWLRIVGPVLSLQENFARRPLGSGWV